MPKLTVEVAKEFDVLPDESLILVEVASIETRDVPARDGREGWQKLEFKFTIRDLPPQMRNDEAYVELLGGPIWGSVTARLTTHPDNKLRQWAEALLNMGELDAGFELDTDLLVGRQAKAVTGSYTRKDGKKRHQVDDLLPPGPLGGASMPDFLNTPAQPVQQAQPAQPVQPAVQPAAAAMFDEDPPF